MKTWIIAYVASAIAFLGLDAVWLTIAGPNLYRPLLGDLLIDGFKVAPAACFYLLYLFGIIYFAVAPAIGASSWRVALGNGALLGLIAYATYDLTNQATIRGWPMAVTLADLAWGTVLSATAATVGYTVARLTTA